MVDSAWEGKQGNRAYIIDTLSNEKIWCTVLETVSSGEVKVNFDSNPPGHFSIIRYGMLHFEEAKTASPKSNPTSPPAHDPVYAPSHYLSGRNITATDCCRDWNLNFFLGNAVKYISRAGRKEGATTLQDLEKAAWYLGAEIQFLKGEMIKSAGPAMCALISSGQGHSISASQADANGAKGKK